MKLQRAPSRVDTIFPVIVAILIFVFPAATLIIPRGGNSIFFGLVVASAYFLYFSRHSIHRHAPSQHGGPLGIFIGALSFPMAAIITAEAFHGDIVSNTLGAPLRFLLAPIIFLALRHLKNLPPWIDSSFSMGAIVAAGTALYSTKGLITIRAESAFLNPIHFGNIALLLGALSLLSINWLRRDNYWLLALKFAGALAGGYASLASQSRGGWIALPFLLALWLFFPSNEFRTRNKLIAAIIVTGTLAIAFFSQTAVTRFEQLKSDIASFNLGETDTSAGIRIEQWRVASDLIRKNPIIGLGAHGYSNTMPELAQSGDLSEMTSNASRGEIHNQILAYTVNYGIFGLLAILGVHFGPIYFFSRIAANARTGQRQRRAALMGLFTATGFALFGLTVEIFNLQLTVAFYCAMLSIFAGIALPARAASPQED